MWKLVLVLMIVTNTDQRVIVQQAVDRNFASQAECEAFTKGWLAQQNKAPELQRIAEQRAPAHRGQMKTVQMIDAGCADPTWSGAFPVLKPEEGFPPAAPKGKGKPAH